MASKRNNSGSSRRKQPVRKPTTIDAEAKEVISNKAGAAKSGVIEDKPGSPQVSKAFGRDAKPGAAPAATKKTSTVSKAKVETKAPNKASSNTDNKSSSMAQKSSGGGMGLALMSAVLGGVVTVGGLGIIGQTNSAGSLPLIGPLFAGSSEQNKEIGGLKKEVTSIKEVAGTTQKALTTGIADLKGGLDGLGQKLNAVETTQKGLAKSSDAQTNSKNIEELLGRLKIAEKTVATEKEVSAAAAKAIEQLTVRVAALEEQTQKQAEALPNFDTLKTGVAGTQAAVTAVRKKESEIALSIATLASRLDTLEGTVTTDLTAKLETVSKAAESASTSEKVAKSVSLSSMQASMERGTSYLSALASYETLVGETEETAKLKELAGKGGTVSAEQLAKEFEPVSDSMLAELSPVTKEDASLMDRLLGSAKSLVKTRSSGPVAGETPEAVISRIKASLAKGNLASVVTEWDGLPDEAKNVGAAYLGKVKARIEAGELMSKLLSQASLNG